jgi:hypothetical protein
MQHPVIVACFYDSGIWLHRVAATRFADGVALRNTAVALDNNVLR